MKVFILSIFLGFCFQNIQASPYQDLADSMLAFQQQNSSVVDLISIGNNDEGNAILAFRFRFPESRQNKVHHLLVGTHHGNEQLSVNVAMEFARQLAYILKTSNDPHHNIFKNFELTVVPVLNISGYNYGRRRERSRMGHDLDPNRDYPDPCVADKKSFQLKSTQNLVNYMVTKNTVAAASIHGYIGTFTFPWGIYTDNSKTLDHIAFQSMASYAVQANGYRVGTHADVIYPATGAFEDYAYAGFGIWSVLLEIDHAPDIAKDAYSLIRYFSAAPKQRSQNFDHTGSCTALRNGFGPRTPRSRP